MKQTDQSIGRARDNIVMSSGEYWERPLGSYYSEFFHRLAMYLLMFTAYVLGTMLTGCVFYGTAWIALGLAFVSGYALHTAFFFAGSFALADIGASRLAKKRLGYSRRTVGRQWLVMMVGFFLGYALFRAAFHHISGAYGPWLFGPGQILPYRPWQWIPELFYCLVFWLPMAQLIIQFALWRQDKGLEPKLNEAGSAHGPAGQNLPKTPIGLFTLSNQNQSIEIPFAEITHVTVEDHYCRLCRKDGNGVQSHIIRMPLKRVEAQLPGEQFARIHRSHIVNLGHVLGWRMVDNGRRLVMDHGIDELPISRHRFGEINHIMQSLKRFDSNPWQAPAFDGNPPV